MILNIGIDVGSTTVKLVVYKGDEIIYKKYERHMSQVQEATINMLVGAKDILKNNTFTAAISGSAGLGISNNTGIDFVQEVFATRQAVVKYSSDTDVVIELGGEDAKIIFLTDGIEERMNGSCAGGTGSFIDQMALLLNLSVDEMDKLSLKHTKIYPIASRCGVFAKTDIQPLLNQGAKKEDLAASIYQSVVDQTIVGLACGRQIKGNVMFLGGPLYFLEGLKERFKEALNLNNETARFPKLAQYAVAIGACDYGKKIKSQYTYDNLIDKLTNIKNVENVSTVKPLFKNKTEFDSFIEYHNKDNVPSFPIENYKGDAYIGIDCGSTTTKLVLMSDNYDILYKYYNSNNGNPVEIIKNQLQHIYDIIGDDIKIKGAVSTGYGEELVKSAFSLDNGVVETIAHFKAAKHFNPKVDFILDIGGQDIKCFKIKNNSIDNIMLNEACSSGCGSFLETFAKQVGYDTKTFSEKGLYATHPFDLGSRCTVFMNSSVKQAQKDGATTQDISAGLSISVVKNVIYKVIRAKSTQELGENIVVQGGTFLNNAVLRSFEREIGKSVIRPNIAGLMGAYGACIYAKELNIDHSSIITKEKIKSFTHTSNPLTCKGCTNKCNLTINCFSDGKKYISGNRCEKPLGNKQKMELPDLYDYKLNKIKNLSSKKGNRGIIGIPLVLNMYENIFFWHEFWQSLGFEVVVSDISSRKLYRKGQHSIPSDTVCYPAKLAHGHIENLLDKGVKNIFYPCMTYNINEKKGDNHFNCPIVAYYPQLLKVNMENLSDTTYMYPFINFNNKKIFDKNIYKYIKQYFGDITLKEIKKASEKAYKKYDDNIKDVEHKGQEAIAFAKEHNKHVIVLAGRPYHIDPEINHGINKLITSLGLVLVSEDCVCNVTDNQEVDVLNQWTYHTRLYNSAKYVTEHANTDLVQLVSFGCGIDAVTTDEVNSILHSKNKLYTQLKIDEINNLGAIKIRLRSLIGAIEERKKSFYGKN